MFEEYEDEAEDYRVQPLNPADRYSGAVVLVVLILCAVYFW